MLVVDNTLLRSVAACDTQALLRHVFGLTTAADRAPLEAGACTHEALAVYLRTGSAAKALAVYDGLYGSWAAEHADLIVGTSRGEAILLGDSRLSHANTRAILARWLETHPLAEFPVVVRPEHVEVVFQLSLARGVAFAGRLDALGQDRATGAWQVVEFKTTSRVDDDFLAAFQMDSQNSGYVWAAARYFDVPVVGSLLGAVEFSRLPGSDRKCPKHGTAYAECGPYHATWGMTSITRSAEALEAWRGSALSLTRKFKELKSRYRNVETVTAAPMQGTFTGACRWCFARDWCAVGRPAAAVSSMFVYEPWVPGGARERER